MPARTMGAGIFLLVKGEFATQFMLGRGARRNGYCDAGGVLQHKGPSV